MSYRLMFTQKPTFLHAIVTGTNSKANVKAESDLMKFAETVAVNRGLPVKVFASVSDAERWLLGKDRGGTQRYAQGDTSDPHR